MRWTPRTRPGLSVSRTWATARPDYSTDVVKCLSIMADDDFPVADILSDEASEPEVSTTTEAWKVIEHTREFFILEYDALRKEIMWMLQDSRTVERNVLIAIAIFWAFLIKESEEVKHLRYGHLAWSIPVLFAGLGSLRSWTLLQKLRLTGEYIQKVEKHLLRLDPGKHSPEGWERFQKYHYDRQKKDDVTISGYVFWVTLLLMTMAVAYLGPK